MPSTIEPYDYCEECGLEIMTPPWRVYVSGLCFTLCEKCKNNTSHNADYIEREKKTC